MVTVEAKYFNQLKSQVVKSKAKVQRMDKQIAFVKGICDQIVNGVKQELAEVEAEKQKLETDIMDIMTGTSAEKREMEEEFDTKLDCREETIRTLEESLEQMRNGDMMFGKKGKRGKSLPPQALFTDKKEEVKLLNQIASLKEERKTTEGRLREKLLEKEDLVVELEGRVSILKGNLRRREESIVSLQRELGGDTATTLTSTTSSTTMLSPEDVMQEAREEREDLSRHLDRVAMLQQQTDSSLQTLEELAQSLQDSETATNRAGLSPETMNAAQALLTKSKLVREEVATSLQILEIKLMNRLANLDKDDKQFAAHYHQRSTSEDRDVASSIRIMSDDIRDELRSALMEVDEEMTGKISQLDVDHKGLLTDMETRLANKETAVTEHERTIKMLRQRLEQLQASRKEESMASRAVMEKLQKEVLSIVDRIKDKDKTIGKLTGALETRKAREGNLLKELAEMRDRVKSLG